MKLKNIHAEDQQIAESCINGQPKEGDTEYILHPSKENRTFEARVETTYPRFG